MNLPSSRHKWAVKELCSVRLLWAGLRRTLGSWSLPGGSWGRWWPWRSAAHRLRHWRPGPRSTCPEGLRRGGGHVVTWQQDGLSMRIGLHSFLIRIVPTQIQSKSNKKEATRRTNRTFRFTYVDLIVCSWRPVLFPLASPLFILIFKRCRCDTERKS